MAISLCSKHEIDLLDFGLESILEKTKNEINTTLYLSRFTESLHEDCVRIAEKYDINYEPRGDNSVIHYNNGLKHTAFDTKNLDCAMTIQPDTVFLKKDVFDSIVDEASEHFDSKYYVCVSSDLPNDTSPLGIVFHTKLGWEKVGCEDINFYPQAGGEHDYHRRCYIAYGLDPNDMEQYCAPVHGQTTPPWTHRIRHKDFYHIGKPWHAIDPRLEYPRGIDYALQVFFECVLWDRYVPYYIEKWGGYQSKERFIVPFNNEKNSVRIGWEEAENPYPESRFISLRGLII